MSDLLFYFGVVILSSSTLFAKDKTNTMKTKLVADDQALCPLTETIAADDFQCDAKGKCQINRAGIIVRRVAFRLESKIALRKKAKPQIHQGNVQWHSYNPTWGTYVGKISGISDAKSHCYSLERGSIPGGVDTKDIHLDFGPLVRISDVSFSDVSSEAPVEKCPIPGIGVAINKAYENAKKSNTDLTAADTFTDILAQALPKYDCRRKFDSFPVPAWYLCSEVSANKDKSATDCSHEDIEYWFDLLAKLKTPKAEALYASSAFRDTLDGAIAEMHLDESLKREKALKKK